jgi:hypothetical protein
MSDGNGSAVNPAWASAEMVAVGLDFVSSISAACGATFSRTSLRI